MGTSYEDQYTFLNISRSIILITRNVSDKSCKENQSTYLMISILFFFFENRAVYEINVETYSTAGEVTDGNMEHAYFTLDT
jgi:hypothetical protein